MVGDGGKPLERHVHDERRRGLTEGLERVRLVPLRGREDVVPSLETRKRGFPTPDGVHMGPCEIHRRHAHTLGPDGSLYACPGFTGDKKESTGHIDGREETWRQAAAERFERLSPLKDECGDCSFIPVCGGGCSVAAHTELGDMYEPSCHKTAFDMAVVGLAERTVGGNFVNLNRPFTRNGVNS